MKFYEGMKSYVLRVLDQFMSLFDYNNHYILLMSNLLNNAILQYYV